MRTRTIAITGTCLLALLAGLTGCDDKASKSASTEPVRRAPPPPPPPPPEVNFDALLQTERADPRVQIAPAVETSDEDLARATIALAGALARGDADAMRSLVVDEAEPVVDTLVQTGGWADATGSIEAVRVTALSGTSATLAVQDAGGAYPLVWTVVRGEDGVTRFNGEPAPDVELGRASEFDNGIPEPEQAVASSFTPSMRYPTMADIQKAAEDPETKSYLERYQAAHDAWMPTLGDAAFYLNYRLGADWAKGTAGADLNSDAGKQAVAQQLGMGVEQIDSKIEAGRAAWQDGERCTPAEMLGTIESFTLMPAFAQPERAVVAKIAEYTGLTAGEIRSMADRARADGPSVFAGIVPPEPDAAEPEPEEEDDGYIEKSTPAGPVRIPTKRPGEGG